MSANQRFETIGDVAHRRLNVTAFCGCGHRATIAGEWLARFFMVRAWDRRMMDVQRRLRCSRCGARAEAVRPTSDLPTVTHPPRNEDEWRRLMRRLRG